MADDTPAITKAAFDRLISDGIPMSRWFDCTTEELTRGRARLRLPFDERHIRPGDTVSGPAIFTLVDTALYAAVLSEVGLEPLAVTTDIQIRYLRRAGRCDLIAEARLLKRGRRLAIGDVTVYAEGRQGAVAHATGTYALPLGRSGDAR
jgi:uncharacterized protein (TIGR00369 family)